VSQPQSLTAEDIRQREAFIFQYMTDFDAYQAVLRLNYGEKGAAHASQWFMTDAYVLNRIEEEKNKLGISTDEEMHRRRVVAGLYRIANNKKASASAQVAAWGQLSKILGMEAPTKSVTTVQGAPTELTFRVVRAEDGRPAIAPAPLQDAA